MFFSFLSSLQLVLAYCLLYLILMVQSWLFWFIIFSEFDLVLLIFSGTVIPMLEAVLDVVPIDMLAVHFHDTYGQALSNILISLQVSYILGCWHVSGTACRILYAFTFDPPTISTAKSTTWTIFGFILCKKKWLTWTALLSLVINLSWSHWVE